jgi:hypothetical protein
VILTPDLFFLAAPPRSSGSEYLESLGQLTQQLHAEIRTTERDSLGDLAGWWLDLRKLRPEALATFRSDWLEVAMPRQPPQALADTVTLYCPLSSDEGLEEEVEAYEIRRQAHALLHDLKPLPDEKAWQHLPQELFASCWQHLAGLWLNHAPHSDSVTLRSAHGTPRPSALIRCPCWPSVCGIEEHQEGW